MAKKDVSAIVSGMGMALSILQSLADKAKKKGCTDEDLHRLATPEGEAILEKIADLIAESRNLDKGVFSLFVDYSRLLDEMIKDNKFDRINPYIAEKNFPINKRPNGELDMKVFSAEDLVGQIRWVSSDEALQALEKMGYRPAELPEGLAYAKVNPDKQRLYAIGLLGSIWHPWPTPRLVPVLWGDNTGRLLSLNRFMDGWRSCDRFLAVRKS